MAAWALRQRGNVTRAQLLAAGFSRDVINRRVRRGSLHPRFPGVYLVGHRAEPPLSREYAALLHCSPRAMLSHRTAARVWALPAPRITDIEVTVVGHTRGASRGLQIYSIGQIEPAELRRHEGLPITSPSLTLLDLAGVLSEKALASALNEARVQGLVGDGEIDATLVAHPKRRGARALARLLAREVSTIPTESAAERRCLELMVAHGLAPDESQAEIGPYRVDFLYRRERLIVEVDGLRFHGTRYRTIRDHRRTTALMAMGYEVFPLTWFDLTDQPTGSMTRLRRALETRRRREIAQFPAW